ncbi:MAG: hypothetical protein OXI44_01415 [Bacteroidota bacterium]|nr:hypothetical protein [Bacteroidota bacterium]
MNKYDVETYEFDPSDQQGSIRVIETDKPDWKKQWWAGIDDLIEADDKAKAQEKIKKQGEKTTVLDD